MKNLLKFGILLVVIALILAYGCERKVINESGNDLKSDATVCFTCHSDSDRDLVAAEVQWAVSKHASGDNIDRNRINNSFYSSCEKCHTSEGFLANLDGETATGNYFTPFGCFTCHAPHTNGNLDLRLTDVVTLADGFMYDKGNSNICAACHQSRRDVSTYVVDGTDLDERFGPHHSNQADMLMGTNGYEYAGYDYENSPHTNVITEGCNTCHMSASGDITLGGHSWKMVDEVKEHYNRTGCNLAECHSGEFDETFAYEADDDYDWDGDETETVQEEIAGLMDSLEVLLEQAGLVEDGEILEVTVNDADTAGAVFNWAYVHEDQSEGIHNTEYAVGLLQSAINYMAHGDPEGIKYANRNRNIDKSF